MGTNSIVRLKSILDKGDFQSRVSSSAKAALKNSIMLRKKYIKTHTTPDNSTEQIFLDFTKINKLSIEKRGNLKVYQNLPKGIRVVAR